MGGSSRRPRASSPTWPGSGRLWEAVPEGVDAIEEKHLERFGDVSEALGSYYADAMAEAAGGDAALERIVREWFGQRLIRAGAVWYELAHDRLVGPVVDDNAAWQEEHLSEVQRRAALWERQGRPAGLLLAGAELDEGEAWAAENASLETASECRFLDASREARAAAERQRRQARRIRRLAVTSTIVGILALAAGAVAAWQWWEAESRKTTAIAQTEKARDLARAAIAGRLLATASADGTARIWNSLTGEKLAVLH